MIRSLYRSPEGQLRQDLAVPDDLLAALSRPGGFLWVDFADTPPEHDEPILRRVFGFHPLAIDDALQESHVPKVDDWGQYLYLVLHAATYDVELGVDTLELDIFLGGSYIVTHHDKPVAAVDRVWSMVLRDERHAIAGVQHLLYLLTDELVVSYTPAIDAIDDAIDLIEAQVLDSPGPEVPERIFALKRSLLRLRRVIAPQREVLNKLARDDYAVIDVRSRVFFRDVYDHLVRLYDLSENLRDLVSGALDTYLSVVNNRMNEVMKTLTLITTLFMPLSFVVGFFGMNFFQPTAPLPGWTSYHSFALTLVAMVAVPLAMYLWMRRRAWM